MQKLKNIKIVLRWAQPKDAPAISSVLAESFEEYSSLYTRAGLRATTPSKDKVMTRMQEGQMWVATLKGQIVGTVSVASKDSGLYIRGMAVIPKARGRGTGSALLQKVIDYAREHEHRRLYLSTTPFLTDAIKLYEHYGFKKLKEQPSDYYGTPIFRMELILENSKNHKVAIN